MLAGYTVSRSIVNATNWRFGEGYAVTSGPSMRMIQDVLGVEVIFSHTSVTGLFPFPTVDWTEAAVMQIEPDTRGTQ